MENPLKEFGNNLRKIRQRKRISGPNLANRLNINYKTYNNYENGVWPSIDIIIGIVKELKITYNELFEPFLEEYPENKEFQELYKKFDLIKSDPRSIEILKRLFEIVDIWTEDIEKRRA